MHSKLAKRVTTASRSFTRTILDLTAQSDIISFAGGLPDASLFPKALFKNYANALFEKDDNLLFQYSNASGVEALKIEIAKQYEESTSKEIMLTNGSQQALDLVCKTFLDEKNCIIVEDPSYLAALNLFHMYDADIKTVPLHQDGADLTSLEELFSTCKPKFFYTIPVFQNPTGYEYTLENKQAVARLAKKYDVILLEDNPYEALRYKGAKSTSFATLLPEFTISLGTFSKTLAPDFRIGWIKAPHNIIEALIGSKESTDLQNSKFFQHIAAMMIKNGDLKTHTQALIAHYKVKRDTMIQELEETFGESISFVKPKGGMFIWVNFKKCQDSMQLFERAIQKGVAFVPGSVFFADKRVSSFGRLNYTNSNLAQIKIGIKKLHEAYEGFN